jgi:glycosyltransferase involved in cell wall biosynthesis
MDPFSVIVPAHNNQDVIRRTLQSVEDAIRFFYSSAVEFRDVPVEVVVVDDGSTDDTWNAIRTFAAGKAVYRMIRRPNASSASCARNEGVARSTGSLLFFLDGDDRFLPSHIVACYRALRDEGCDYVKTGMHLADPVHPEWKERIEYSSPINLCVRRECHFVIGGFPDYHLFVRQGERFVHLNDIFKQNSEDSYYNQMLSSVFTGRVVRQETVEYIRYPGNAYDRQYERFRQAPGAYQEPDTEDLLFRFQLGDVILRSRLASLKRGESLP